MSTIVSDVVESGPSIEQARDPAEDTAASTSTRNVEYISGSDARGKRGYLTVLGEQLVQASPDLVYEVLRDHDDAVSALLSTACGCRASQRPTLLAMSLQQCIPSLTLFWQGSMVQQ